jgi:hypothetical protein
MVDACLVEAKGLPARACAQLEGGQATSFLRGFDADWVWTAKPRIVRREFHFGKQERMFCAVSTHLFIEPVQIHYSVIVVVLQVLSFWFTDILQPETRASEMPVTKLGLRSFVASASRFARWQTSAPQDDRVFARATVGAAP